MQITMTHTKRDSQDGRSVELFEAGKEYDILPNLACSFIRDGIAVESKYMEATHV